MADSDPLSQMFNLFAAPLAGAVQSFEQFRKGVDQFQRGVENFNRTMENLNETAERINGLLAEVEEPLRAAVPQVTRTVKAADEMMRVVSGPAIAVAPGLQVLAETLNNPALRQVPNQLAQMNEVLGEVTARLAPLGQLAESAGGLFGGLRLPGFGGPRPEAARVETTPVPHPEPEQPAHLTVTRTVTVADDSSGRRQPATGRTDSSTRAPAKKTAGRKKAAGKKAASRKTSRK
jgi:hypothetical protein